MGPDNSNDDNDIVVYVSHINWTLTEIFIKTDGSFLGADIIFQESYYKILIKFLNGMWRKPSTIWFFK